jgi:hypothetical protein
LIKRRLCILTLLIMVCFSNYSIAAPSNKLDGKPVAFDSGNSTGYFIWQDNDGLHLRSTTTQIKRVFSGTISTDGNFEDVFGRYSGGDDYFRINEKRDQAVFQFTTTGDTASIDLRIFNGTNVSFNLSMDGKSIDPVNIFIGWDGWHPDSHKFTLRHTDGDSERCRNGRTVFFCDDSFGKRRASDWGDSPLQGPGPQPGRNRW